MRKNLRNISQFLLCTEIVAIIFCLIRYENALVLPLSVPVLFTIIVYNVILICFFVLSFFVKGDCTVFVESDDNSTRQLMKDIFKDLGFGLGWWIPLFGGLFLLMVFLVTYMQNS